MGRVFKKPITRPLPRGAEIVTRQNGRVATWGDSKGKLRTAPVTAGKDGALRIRDRSKPYYARYRDGNGEPITVPTKCRDETAARQVLATLERRAERVRAGLITAAEDRIADQLTTSIAGHVAAYIESMKDRGIVPMHREDVRRQLDRIIKDCRVGRLADLSREILERWMGQAADRKRSARSRNAHRAAIIAFANWCVAHGRLQTNPILGIAEANEAADPRRRRRAMTEEELERLLDVARYRPLRDALTIRRGKRKGEAVAKVRPETRAQLEALGRERAIIYKTLVLTGLRKGELASLTAAQMKLEAPVPHVELDAEDEKNREGNRVVVRPDLAADLLAWLADKLSALQAEARRREAPIPERLPAGTPVFDVPNGLVRIFDRDLKAAGIPKRDERGRTLDLHALRTTFNTLMQQKGVSLRTAQAAMRHSDPNLTANVYTDEKLLDVSGALQVLPSLPLDGGTGFTRGQVSEDVAPAGRRSVAPNVAPPDDFSCPQVSPDGKMGESATDAVVTTPVAASRCPETIKGPADFDCQPALHVGAIGFEPTTSSTPS
jgi:integrase